MTQSLSKPSQPSADGGTYQPVDHTWAAGLEVKAGQIVENAGTLYKVDADMTLPGVFDTTGLTAVGGGGGGAAPGPSGLGMTQGSTSGETVTAGSASNLLIASTITEGEDIWGVPGSALPLGATAAPGDDSQLLYPQDDAVYDIVVKVFVTTDAADAGKPVNVRIFGNFNGLTATKVVPAAGGQIQFRLFLRDYVFTGDLPAGPSMSVDASDLAHDLTGISAYVTLVSGGG